MADEPRILILDDEPIVLMDLAMAVADSGLRPVEVRSVPDALAAIDADPPDAAVLDVHLGGGATCAPVAKRLRGLLIPFLLHTGDDLSEAAIVAELGGEMVAKPSYGDDVARRLCALLDRPTA